MKRRQLLIAVVAVIAVALVAAVARGRGDGGEGDTGGGNGGGGAAAPQGAVRIPFAYSPEKEKVLVPLREEVGAVAAGMSEPYAASA